ncbi:hypothetical protein PAMP_017523 [Pampus punctatissimus]
MAICPQSYGIFCLFTIQTVLIICVSTPTAGTHLFPQHYTMIHWAGRIEKELEKVLQHVTGTQQMRSYVMMRGGVGHCHCFHILRLTQSSLNRHT